MFASSRWSWVAVPPVSTGFRRPSSSASAGSRAASAAGSPPTVTLSATIDVRPPARRSTRQPPTGHVADLGNQKISTPPVPSGDARTPGGSPAAPRLAANTAKKTATMSVCGRLIV